MIPRSKLKFDERDLEFFERQRDVKKFIPTEIHWFVLGKIHHKQRISGEQLAKLANINGAEVRKIVLDFRRYFGTKGYFITANEKGYTKSCLNECCENDLIAYFDKTQTRFKETFNELYHLMKCLNEVQDGKEKETM